MSNDFSWDVLSYSFSTALNVAFTIVKLWTANDWAICQWRKNIRFESGWIIFLFNNFFDWQMAQPLTVQNLNFEPKRGSCFLFTRFIQVFSFLIWFLMKILKMKWKFIQTFHFHDCLLWSNYQFFPISFEIPLLASSFLSQLTLRIDLLDLDAGVSNLLP